MTTSRPRTEPFWLGYVLDALLARHGEATTYTKLSIQRRGGMYGRLFHRMQVLKSSNSMLSTMYRFGLRDGIPSLWGGLSASILRQGTYSTARFGLHNHLSSQLLQTSGRDRLPASWNIACAGVSGGIAGLIGNPTEVVLVRMCADGAKPAKDRFRYSNPLVGLWRVWKEEGAKAFGRGIGPNVTRSVLMNRIVGHYGNGLGGATQAGLTFPNSYASAKQSLLASNNMSDNITTHALASLMAGTVATTLCAPADVLKSRMQSSAKGDGLLQIVRNGLRDEGPRFLMKGWTPAWLRLTPHTVLTFVFMEQLRRLSQLTVSQQQRDTAKM
ncbi:Mitochondrial 2-oxoglutarate/malate carrier protein [Metarhizium brunneum]|uniref:Mitochondrial 2-oxoglutarate/malate carrier protein n=1 Tax=Metarhizium brunneum TaxID=500148 RepID=A0A7D5V1Y4_9HYPO|nr:Mitochondrial 2-oxoglutarate/malate carrier protein [Metarhizium brunneum]